MMTVRRGLILSAIAIAAVVLYLLFKPLGLLWLYRTGGWDSWSKAIEGRVTDNGAAVFQVKLKWDFVNLSIVPKSAAEPLPSDEVMVQVVNHHRQSIVVDFWRGKGDGRHEVIDDNTHLYKVTDGAVRVYEGSLAELNEHWSPIKIQRADGGERLDLQLEVKRKHGAYQPGAIPFSVEARWRSYGL